MTTPMTAAEFDEILAGFSLTRLATGRIDEGSERDISAIAVCRFAELALRAFPAGGAKEEKGQLFEIGQRVRATTINDLNLDMESRGIRQAFENGKSTILAGLQSLGMSRGHPSEDPRGLNVLAEINLGQAVAVAKAGDKTDFTQTDLIARAMMSDLLGLQGDARITAEKARLDGLSAFLMSDIAEQFSTEKLDQLQKINVIAHRAAGIELTETRGAGVEEHLERLAQSRSGAASMPA